MKMPLPPSFRTHLLDIATSFQENDNIKTNHVIGLLLFCDCRTHYITGVGVIGIIYNSHKHLFHISSRKERACFGPTGHVPVSVNGLEEVIKSCSRYTSSG